MGASLYATGPAGLKTMMTIGRKPWTGGTGEVVLKPGVDLREVEWFLSIDCSDKESWWFPIVKKSYYDILLDSRLRILGYRAVLVQRGSL